MKKVINYPPSLYGVFLIPEYLYLKDILCFQKEDSPNSLRSLSIPPPPFFLLLIQNLLLSLWYENRRLFKKP